MLIAGQNEQKRKAARTVKLVAVDTLPAGAFVQICRKYETKLCIRQWRLAKSEYML
jgi:hypothetical protein